MNSGAVTRTSVLKEIHDLARPLKTDRDLSGLVRRAADCRFVAIGEASHGTHEYYTWRDDAQPAADRGEGLLLHRRRGGLARLLPRQPLRPRPGRSDSDVRRDVLQASSAGRPGCGPTRRSRRRGVAARAQRRAARATSGSASTAWTSTACGTRCTRSSATSRPTCPTPCPRPCGRFQCFEPYGEDAQEYAASTRLVPQSCEDEVVALLAELRRRAAIRPRDDEDALRRRAERPGREERRALLPHDGPRRTGVVEHPRPAHGRDARAADAAPRAGRRRRSSGSTTPTSATPATPTWPRTGMVNVGQLAARTARAPRRWCWSASPPTAAASSPADGWGAPER